MNLLAFLFLPFLVAAEVDTSKLQWSVLSLKLQRPQSDMTANLGPDGKIYIAGGCISPTGSIYNENSQILQCSQDTDTLYSFDPATNTFQNLPRLPRNRCRHGAAIANGKLFLIGGRTAVDDELIPEIDVYDIATKQWNAKFGTLAPNVVVSDLAAFSQDNNIYFLGGLNFLYQASKQMWRIDATQSSLVLTPMASMFEARFDIQATVNSNGQAFVAGGTTHRNDYCPPLKTVEMYTISSNTWSKLADLTSPRADMALSELDDNLFAVGGEQPYNLNCVTPSLNPTELISVKDTVSFLGNSLVWTDVIQLKQPRVRFPSVTVGSKTYFFGGENGFDSVCSCYPTTDEILVLQQVEPTAAPTPAPTPAPTTLAPTPAPTTRKPTPAPTTVKPTAAPAPSVSKKPSTSRPTTRKPTVSPAQTGSKSPSAPTIPALCFSGDSVVDVWNKGSVLMKDLSIGDNVRVQGGKYSQVYSFGHYDKEVMTEYLSIHAGLAKPLIISDDHMVFVDNKAIPASAVKLGDRLTLVDGIASVRYISRVVRTGAFAPFTKDGTIVVNDVVASSYISMKQTGSANLVVAGLETVSMHQVAHLFQAPHRLVCEVSPGFCTMETYKDGLSIWIDRPHAFFRWLLRQDVVIFTMIFVPVLALVLILAAIETVILNPAALLAGLAAVVIFVRRIAPK